MNTDSGRGFLRAEVQDAGGQPLAGFALADCNPLTGDRVEKVMTWTGGGIGKIPAGDAKRGIRVRFAIGEGAVFYGFSFARSA